MEDSHAHILSLPDDPETTWFSVFGKALNYHFPKSAHLSHVLF